MDLTNSYFNKSEYVETASGNKVSRQTVLCGSQNIILSGKVIVQSDAIIRGDLANVRVGRYCILSKNSVIRPPFKKFSKGVAFFPLQIGDNVYVGENTYINSASIGSYIYIGKNCVIINRDKTSNFGTSLKTGTTPVKLRRVGRCSLLKDCCYIEDNTVLPPETIVPSFTRFSGSPGVCVGELSECTQDMMIDFTRDYYQKFVPNATYE